MLCACINPTKCCLEESTKCKPLVIDATVAIWKYYIPTLAQLQDVARTLVLFFRLSAWTLRVVYPVAVGQAQENGVPIVTGQRSGVMFCQSYFAQAYV